MKAQKKRYTILVVEDEAPIRKVIVAKLALHNFTVITEKSVEEALARLNAQADRIDALWLDHYLPGEGSGITLVAHLKQDAKFKNLPIFVVSNTAGKDKIQEYKKMGITKYYVKAENMLGQIIKEMKAYLDNASKKQHP